MQHSTSTTITPADYARQIRAMAGKAAAVATRLPDPERTELMGWLRDIQAFATKITEQDRCGGQLRRHIPPWHVTGAGPELQEVCSSLNRIQ